MLSNFVDEAFSAIDTARPTVVSGAQYLEGLAGEVADWYGDPVTPNDAAAHWAAGYLAELLGEDYRAYILGCWTVNDDLTESMD